MAALERENLEEIAELEAEVRKMQELIEQHQAIETAIKSENA
jgi:hypothetical protein